ncbi:hypothetical protein Ciccas_005739 [Cichlidogyrus casuarinus]|uniref:Uncharacterized protein n=1 Tax=Cichlidogyrus casuarinus TaxID=1844966 RepID=A0ABD2QA64_9PLAT
MSENVKDKNIRDVLTSLANTIGEMIKAKRSSVSSEVNIGMLTVIEQKIHDIIDHMSKVVSSVNKDQKNASSILSKEMDNFRQEYKSLFRSAGPDMKEFFETIADEAFIFLDVVASDPAIKFLKSDPKYFDKYSSLCKECCRDSVYKCLLEHRNFDKLIMADEHLCPFSSTDTQRYSIENKKFVSKILINEFVHCPYIDFRPSLRERSLGGIVVNDCEIDVSEVTKSVQVQTGKQNKEIEASSEDITDEAVEDDVEEKSFKVDR